MTTTVSSQAQGIRWDLSDLYESPDDPALERDLAEAESGAKRFEAEYRPLFAAPAKLPLARLLADYKKLVTLMTKPGVYAYLRFAERTSDPAAAAFLQRTQTRLTDIGSFLLFFEVSWNRLDDAAVKAKMAEPEIAADRHFLEKMRRFAPYTLSEGEEKVLAIKSDTGPSAFRRLFDEVMNAIPFYLEIDGKRVKKTETEVLALLHSTDRAERRRASLSLAEGLDANTHILTFCYNMVLADHRSTMKLRGLKHPMDTRNLANEIPLPGVLNLVERVKAAYPLAMRYYKLKRRLLGLDKLYDYDRYAAVSSSDETIHFDRCREMVTEGYDAFSPEAGKIVRQFFDKRWIDAEVREGKRGGGFCCQTTPELHPYILVNYTGSLRDVMTVAHELGHGIHQYLSRQAGPLESDAPLTLAETASVFGEMLIFDRVLAEAKDGSQRLALLCGKIDDNFATVFRQIAMTDFELMAHTEGLEKGELPAERLCELWIEANRRLYGDSVELTPEYRHGWKYIPHFVHSPFYCYAYAFAQLFVLTLFREYKKDPGAFLPKYFRMLSLGGSKDPGEIAGIAGLDVNRPDFWDSGLGLLESLVGQAEVLAGSR